MIVAKVEEGVVVDQMVAEVVLYPYCSIPRVYDGIPVAGLMKSEEEAGLIQFDHLLFLRMFVWYMP
jgi:hypothetical protein